FFFFFFLWYTCFGFGFIYGFVWLGLDWDIYIAGCPFPTLLECFLLLLSLSSSLLFESRTLGTTLWLRSRNGCECGCGCGCEVSSSLLLSSRFYLGNITGHEQSRAEQSMIYTKYLIHTTT
ncbi:hypothetical protein F4811DRAFT_501484, partial [Daldinia bambusicola]